MITKQELQTMSDDEIKALNEQMTRRLVKRFALIIAIKVGLFIAINRLARRLR